MNYNIVSVKDFIKHGPPQFNVLERHEPGKSIAMEFGSASEDLEFTFKETVRPQSAKEGVIKAVIRLSDGQEFHSGDWVESNEGSCFIVSFSEDKIHCDVVHVDDKAGRKLTIEINEVVLAISSDEYGFDEDEENTQTNIEL